MPAPFCQFAASIPTSADSFGGRDQLLAVQISKRRMRDDPASATFASIPATFIVGFIHINRYVCDHGCGNFKLCVVF